MMNLYRPRENLCCGSNDDCCKTKLDLYGIALNTHTTTITQGLENNHAL